MIATQVKLNDYSEKTRKEKLPKLKPGQKVAYELLGLRIDPLDPEKKKLAVPELKGIPATDRIYDKHKGEDGDYIDIAFVTGYGEGGKPIEGHVHFTYSMQGVMVLIGGRARDQALFEYMETCNYNASNPDRDTSVVPMFRRKDAREEAKKKREARQEVMMAVDKARGLNTQMVRQLAAAYRIDPNLDIEEIREKIEDKAFTRPKEFIGLCENKDLVIMEVFSEAERKNIIQVDTQGRKIKTDSGETLCVWAPKPNVNPSEEFVAFVKTEEGQKYYEELKLILKKKK